MEIRRWDKVRIRNHTWNVDHIDGDKIELVGSDSNYRDVFRTINRQTLIPATNGPGFVYIG